MTDPLFLKKSTYFMIHRTQKSFLPAISYFYANIDNKVCILKERRIVQILDHKCIYKSFQNQRGII